MKYYLGMFCFGSHDSAVALVGEDGKVYFAAEEERYDRKKHSAEFPKGALAAAFEELKISWNDIESVRFAWNPYQDWERILPFLAKSIFAWPRFLFQPKQKSASRWQKWQNIRSVPARLSTSGFSGNFRFLSHHLCHAASTFYASGFASALVISVDGNGEFASTSLFHASLAGGIREVRTIDYPNSLGLFYAAITQYLGFSPMNDEFKVMGLAAYRKNQPDPKIEEKFSSLIQFDEKGIYKIDLSFFQYQRGNEPMWSKKLEDLLGAPRKPIDSIEERHYQIAGALQRYLERALIGLAQFGLRETQETKLCIAGGVGLNCVANEVLFRWKDVEEVFVQPAAHDSGSALGAAYLAAREANSQLVFPALTNLALGNEWSEQKILHAIRAAGIKRQTFSEDALLDRTANALAEGKIVAWFQGRMEFGPRALGQRSLLADPRKPESKTKLNAVIKKREGFRPFAPAVCAEEAEQYFDMGNCASPFMVRTVPVLEGVSAKIPAAIHVDATARVQTVAKEQKKFYALLRAFEKLTGLPILLNTSLNQNHEPIVNRPEEALALFLASEIDVLIMENFWMEKD